MKILLVDDEEIVLKGLKMLISTRNQEFEINCACNGREALELARGNKPDIVISDIRMPIMDGLEFIEELYSQYKEVKVIVISAYEDFHYAKKAIDLGVINYVLKPIEQDEFILLLDNVCEEIENERKIKEEHLSNIEIVKKKLLIDLIRYDYGYDITMDKIRKSGIGLCYQGYFIAVMELDDYHLISESRETIEFNQFYRRLGTIIESNLEESGFEIIYSENNPGEFVFLVLSGEERDFGFLQKTVEDIKSELAISVTAGVSKIYPSIMDALKAHREANFALKKSFIKGKGAIYIYIDEDSNLYEILYSKKSSLNLGLLNTYKNLIIQNLNHRNFEDCKKAIQSIFNEISINSYSVETVQALFFEITLRLSEVLVQMGCDTKQIFKECGISQTTFTICNTLEQIKGTLVKVLEKIIIYASRVEKDNKGFIIHRVVKLAEEDYLNITLQSAAEKVGISPIYLSIIFKEKTGENFKDYIIKTKAGIARELLKDPHMKVHEVSERIGYNDSKHFSKMFRKATGLTPSEYRQKLL